jgi:sterol desaturase/sphingolipid hydroxylase (fatty acid hydroxylase superfamily)
MPKNYVSNAPESVRMFKSNFWESLSKVHFTVPLIIYIPVILFFIFKDLFILKEGIVAFICFAALGVFVWSLTEYLLHRFIFHFVPSSGWGLRMHFIFHGVHHDYPNDTRRLVMPPSVSIPLAFLFYFLFSLVLSTQNLYAFFPGFVAGYLVYDISHYAIHHFNFKNKYWKKIKKHHMLHHYADAKRGFGVSSSFWDKVFQSDLKNN